MISDFNMPREKMSDFVSLPLFGLISLIKMRNYNFESHWNFDKFDIKKLWYFFDKKHITSDFNMSHKKMSDFVSLPLFGFTIVIKMGNYDFEGH